MFYNILINLKGYDYKRDQADIIFLSKNLQIS